MSAKIQIEVNGDLKSISANTLSAMLAELNIINTAGLAIAINNEVIIKSDWTKQTVNPGDKILLVSATQGG